MSTAQQQKSWQMTLQELGPRQREVMEWLERHRTEGLSAWELAEKLGRYVHSIRPRLTELKQMGLIKQKGETYHQQTQRHEAVWVPANFEPQLTFL